MPKRDRTDLIRRLQDQMALLQSSAERFDAGVLAEAQQMATRIRVLVHHKKNSPSLLMQLGEQHKLRFFDTWRREQPGPRSRPGVAVRQKGSGLVGVGTTAQGGWAYVAPLGDLPNHILGPKRFKQWWNRRILTDGRGVQFTRATLVLFVANKEGGAHVDPEIPGEFHALTRDNSLGWSFGPEGGPFQSLGDPVPANIRQIAYEVDRTITEQLGHLLAADAST